MPLLTLHIGVGRARATADSSSVCLPNTSYRCLLAWTLSCVREPAELAG